MGRGVVKGEGLGAVITAIRPAFLLGATVFGLRTCCWCYCSLCQAVKTGNAPERRMTQYRRTLQNRWPRQHVVHSLIGILIVVHALEVSGKVGGEGRSRKL